jgi:hypothetical protein
VASIMIMRSRERIRASIARRNQLNTRFRLKPARKYRSNRWGRCAGKGACRPNDRGSVIVARSYSTVVRSPTVSAFAIR